MNQRLVFCFVCSLAVATPAMARPAAAQAGDGGVQPAPLPAPPSDTGAPDGGTTTPPPAATPPAPAPPPVTFAPAPPAPPPVAPPAVVPSPTVSPALAPAPPAPAPAVVPAPEGPPAPPVIAPAPVPETPPPPPEHPPFEREPEPVFRPAILLGVLSVPRPIEIEALLKVRRTLALGVQYSMLPTLSLPDNSASMKLDAAQGTFRWFPFGGVFYVGGGFGYQRLRASIGQTVDGGNLSVLADMSTFFVSPQLGWLWFTHSGFCIGINLGIQIPFPREPSVDVTYNGQPLPSGAPSDLATAASNDKKNVADLARIIMRYPIPNIDLLKIGLAF